ncbi:MAG: tRNA pseudouridine38-40 synthase [Halioglobus sp.]
MGASVTDEVSALSQRIACGIEYDGSGYHGWQLQANQSGSTVQAEVERALAEIAIAPVRVQCAGRTDTGVHASEQIIHFDPPVNRELKAWVQGANRHLPGNVRILWASAVTGDFHARFSAQARRYRYIIANTGVCPAVLRGQVTWHRRPLDEQLMHEEAQVLLGEHDFGSFRAARCQSSTGIRNIHFINVSRRGQLVIIDIKANAFLHHMVRNIAGCLLSVGSGRAEAGWLEHVLSLRDRRQAADTAAPHGLYLVSVEYPAQYSLPQMPLGPLLLG